MRWLPSPVDSGPSSGKNDPMPRFILLQHASAPDDPAGLHYDLLLEAGAMCRTWRLAEIPQAEGDAVPAEEIAPHRLAWLDHKSGEVSGGRGFARRVDGGLYEQALEKSVAGSPQESLRVQLVGALSTRLLALCRGADGWTARIVTDR